MKMWNLVTSMLDKPSWNVLYRANIPNSPCSVTSKSMWKFSADASLWSEQLWDNPEPSMKSKQGRPNQQAAVWTRGDRAAKLSSQLGAQIDGQDRHRICVYPPHWLCLSGTKLVFEQVTIVKECMRGIINEDMQRGCANSVMTFTHVHQPSSFQPPLHASAYLNPPTVSQTIPHTPLKTVQPLHRKKGL